MKNSDLIKSNSATAPGHPPFVPPLLSRKEDLRAPS